MHLKKLIDLKANILKPFKLFSQEKEYSEESEESVFVP
jgi:hypothetical protein